jgi:hypothetical protein
MRLVLASFPLGLAVVVTALVLQCGARPGAGLSAKIALPVNDSPVCETMIQAPIDLEDRALLEPNGQRFLLLLDRTISLPVG